MMTKSKDSAFLVGKASQSCLSDAQRPPRIDDNRGLIGLKHRGKGKLEGKGMCEIGDNSSHYQVSRFTSKGSVKHLTDYSEVWDSRSYVGKINSGFNGGGVGGNSDRQLDRQFTYCPSPQNSFYSAIQFSEAKESFDATDLSECLSYLEKLRGSGNVGQLYDFMESGKLISTYRRNPDSDLTDKNDSGSFSCAMYKPHKGNDVRWDAIHKAQSHYGVLELDNFKLLKPLGSGDVGEVYLAELVGTKTYFAMKIMNKSALESKKKLVRAQTEKEILQCLDHPFLPTLYTHFETEKDFCLVMDFCPGGNLESLRQKQQHKCFPEYAVRFYVAEVLLALEYLHMLGIIYRDLKPENVLLREDGHIMLSDFDLSRRCEVRPTLLKSSNSTYCVHPACIELQPACFLPLFLSNKSKKAKKTRPRTDSYAEGNRLPELLAEPTNPRLMSYVGTHEYVAPEIIRGEGHGSAVDWWSFGIFLYELLFGKTPFKGSSNHATLFNVVDQSLRFPDSPSVSFAAKDLIRGLLVKEPRNRLAYRRGATEIKQHPFFQSINWALIRCATPPDIPKPFMMSPVLSTDCPTTSATLEKVIACDAKPSDDYIHIDLF